VGQIQHLQQVKKRENNPVQHSDFRLELRPIKKNNHFLCGIKNFKYELEGEEQKKAYEHLSGVVEAMFKKSGDLIFRNFHCWAPPRALSSSI